MRDTSALSVFYSVAESSRNIVVKGRIVLGERDKQRSYSTESEKVIREARYGTVSTLPREYGPIPT